MAQQGAYFNQLFRDEPTKSVGIKVHIKNRLSDWSIYFIGLYIIKCMVKINERPHDMALNWMLLDVSVLQKEKKMIIVLPLETQLSTGEGWDPINRFN